MSLINYPYTIGWGITNKCNLQCKHCNMNSGRMLNEEITFDEACCLVDEFHMHNVKNICFTGGEPFSRNDFIDICEYAISKGIYVCVTSNGTLITDEMIQNHLYKFQLVRISLDGIDSMSHDSFRNKKGVYNKAVSTIDKLIKNGCNVGVVTCVSKLNYRDIDRIAVMISNLGVRKWFLPLLSPEGRGEKIKNYALEPLEVRNLLLLINTFKEKYNLEIGVEIPYSVMLPEIIKHKNIVAGNCAAGITQIMIFPNGDISPCFAMKIKCGNIRNDSISDIWINNEVFKAFRDKQLIGGKCHTCEYLKQCGGGCRAVPYIINGDYLGEDSVCWKK